MSPHRQFSQNRQKLKDYLTQIAGKINIFGRARFNRSLRCASLCRIDRSLDFIFRFYIITSAFNMMCPSFFANKIGSNLDDIHRWFPAVGRPEIGLTSAGARQASRSAKNLFGRVTELPGPSLLLKSLFSATLESPGRLTVLGIQFKFHATSLPFIFR